MAGTDWIVTSPHGVKPREWRLTDFTVAPMSEKTHELVNAAIMGVAIRGYQLDALYARWRQISDEIDLKRPPSEWTEDEYRAACHEEQVVTSQIEHLQQQLKQMGARPR